MRDCQGFLTNLGTLSQKIKNVSSTSWEISPVTLPTDNMLIQLSLLRAASGIEQNALFRCMDAGMSCKEGFHYVICNFVSLERDCAAHWRSDWYHGDDSRHYCLSRPQSDATASFGYCLYH